MQIMLKCRDAYGSVAFEAESISGQPAPERRYSIADHQIILSGYPDFILHHDADELLAMPESLYRMPTPQEQDTAVQASQAVVSVQEAVSEPVVEPVEQEQKPEEEQPPVEPDNQSPALLDKIKKAVGG